MKTKYTQGYLVGLAWDIFNRGDDKSYPPGFVHILEVREDGVRVTNHFYSFNLLRHTAEVIDERCATDGQDDNSVSRQ